MNDFIDYTNCAKDLRGVYCASYSMIEEAVGSYLEKNHPKVLISPTPVPIEEWIESGECGFSLEYRNIAFPQAKGITAFSNMAIAAFDCESQKFELIPIEQNTIVLDESLPETELRFTCGHEFVHALGHGYYFMSHANAIAAKSDTYCSSYTKTPIFWLERQADYGAGAFLMPKRTVEILFRQVTGNSSLYKARQADAERKILIERMQEIYNVSFSAARIRLQQLNLIE